MVAAANAVKGPELGKLRETIEAQFKALDEQQQKTRPAMTRIEAGFVRRFLEIQRIEWKGPGSGEPGKLGRHINESTTMNSGSRTGNRRTAIKMNSDPGDLKNRLMKLGTKQPNSGKYTIDPIEKNLSKAYGV